MATCIYVNPDQATTAKGNALGCGWLPSVPPAFAAIASAPCVILSGSGQTVVLPDDATLTPAKVAAALAPILAAEQTAATATATQQTNGDATSVALNAAMLRLAAIITQGTNLAAQGTAWTIAQQQGIAQAVADLALIERRLIRKALALNDASN